MLVSADEADCVYVPALLPRRRSWSRSASIRI